MKVRIQVAWPLPFSVVFDPALQETELPLSKKDTVPEVTAVLSLVFTTKAVMVVGAEAPGGVR